MESDRSLARAEQDKIRIKTKTMALYVTEDDHDVLAGPSRIDTQ